jgi:hypothetical protein
MARSTESAQEMIASVKVIAHLGRTFARPGPAARACARALGRIAGFARLDLEPLLLRVRMEYVVARARCSGRWS